MAGTASGFQVSGMKLSSGVTLNSIGDPRFHWDYRVNVEPILEAGVQRVAQWVDQINNITLVKRSNANPRPEIMPDGIGNSDGSLSSVWSRAFIPIEKQDLFKPFTNLTPTSIYYVFKKVSLGSGSGEFHLGLFNGADSINVAPTITRGGGARYRPSTSVQAIVPDNEFVLARFTHYGGDGANNITMRVKTTSVNISLTSSSEDATYFNLRQVNGENLEWRMQKMIGYVHDGLTPTQINNFDALFCSVLKLDPHYASIVTP